MSPCESVMCPGLQALGGLIFLGQACKIRTDAHFELDQDQLR